MKVIVIGCGRVGSGLSTQLAADGHDVRVVDHEPASRRELPVNFAGSWRLGNGFNRGVLEAAGVNEVDAFVAVTSGDNVDWAPPANDPVTVAWWATAGETTSKSSTPADVITAPAKDRALDKRVALPW